MNELTLTAQEKTNNVVKLVKHLQLTQDENTARYKPLVPALQLLPFATTSVERGKAKVTQFKHSVVNLKQFFKTHTALKNKLDKATAKKPELEHNKDFPFLLKTLSTFKTDEVKNYLTAVHLFDLFKNNKWWNDETGLVLPSDDVLNNKLKAYTATKVVSVGEPFAVFFATENNYGKNFYLTFEVSLQELEYFDLSMELVAAPNVANKVFEKSLPARSFIYDDMQVNYAEMPKFVSDATEAFVFKRSDLYTLNLKNDDEVCKLEEEMEDDLGRGFTFAKVGEKAKS